MKNKKIEQVTTKTNINDWVVYTIVAIVLLIPFFGGEYFKHLSASLIIGFLFGMLNRIIRELVLLREQLNKEE
jgi:preprotein translocase subunit SecF